jgi:syntaxin 16
MSSSSSPPTRSRTGLFLSFRDSTARITHLRHQYDDTNEHDHLIDNSTLLPPQWFVSAVGLSPSIHLPLPGSTTLNKYRRSSQILRQKVCQQLTTISPVHLLPKVTALDKLHAKHVLPGFSDRSLEEREIETLTTDITRVMLLYPNSPDLLIPDLQDFRQCQSLIQKIGLPKHAFPPTQSHHEALAAKNVQRGLAAKVQDLSAAFRKKQRVYMESKPLPPSKSRISCAPTSHLIYLLVFSFFPYLARQSSHAPSYVRDGLILLLSEQPSSHCSLVTLSSNSPFSYTIVNLYSD